MKKLIAILVSVNYGDILKKVINYNLKIVDELIIITTPSDTTTINLAKKYKITYLLSESCYENDAPFNKAKMINIGLKYIYFNYPNDVYLIIDADIILNKNIRNYISIVNNDEIYGANRYIIENINTNITKINLDKYQLENTLGIHNCCIGFTQLFIDKKYYDEIYETAAECDMVFAFSFNKNLLMNDCYSIHLGKIEKNWKGRK